MAFQVGLLTLGLDQLLLTACKTRGQTGQESSTEQDEVGELDVNDSIQAPEMDFIWTLAGDSWYN